MPLEVTTALTSYIGQFSASIIEAVPLVATAALGLLAIKLGINYSLKYFKRFSK